MESVNNAIMKKRILVVDDNIDILELVEIILIRHGFEILKSPRGEDTLKNVETFSPQVILLDVFLGGINGTDICKELKANPRTQDIPIIMFSAHSNSKFIFQECRADDFIAKPFDINNLVQKIESQIKDSN
jgi:DNA-binding response OmpR family regulator